MDPNEITYEQDDANLVHGAQLEVELENNLSQAFASVAGEALAKSSRGQYDTHLRQFQAFLINPETGNGVSIDDFSPAIHEKICNFLGWRYTVVKIKAGTIEQALNALKWYYSRKGRVNTWFPGASPEIMRHMNPALSADLKDFLKGCKKGDKDKLTRQATPICIDGMIAINKLLRQVINGDRVVDGLSPSEAVFYDVLFNACFLLMARIDELAKLKWGDIKLNLLSGVRRYHQIKLTFRKTNQIDPNQSSLYQLYEYDPDNIVDPQELDLFAKLNAYDAYIREITQKQQYPMEDPAAEMVRNPSSLVFPSLSGTSLSLLFSD